MTSGSDALTLAGTDGPALAVVVAMKPQLRGRVRRNVETLLDLGMRVVVISVRSNADFFVGLQSPRLRVEFVETPTAYSKLVDWRGRDANRRAAISRLRLDRARRRHIRTAWRLRSNPLATLRHLRSQPTFPTHRGGDVTPFPAWLMVVAVAAVVPPLAVIAGIRRVFQLTRRTIGRTRRGLLRAASRLSGRSADTGAQTAPADSGNAGRFQRRGVLARRVCRLARRTLRHPLRCARRGLWVPAAAACRAAREASIALLVRLLLPTQRTHRFFSFWRESEKVVLALAPDMVVSSDLPGLVGASRAARTLGVLQVHDCHELYLESTSFTWYERAILKPIERRHMRRVMRVVAVNESIATEYERRCGVQPVVVRNCACMPRNTMVREIRDLAGLGPLTQVVLYQGGFTAGRGLDVCVQAMAELPPSVHLVMLGYGPLASDLKEWARRHGVADRVHVLPAVEPDELLAYTASATIGVIPYQPVSKNNYYSLPNKIFEYTSVGLPVVASDLPELSRIAVDEGCGLVFDPYSPRSLARTIGEALDPTRLGHLRTASRLFGATNTWAKERRALVVAFEDALGAGPRGNAEAATRDARLPVLAHTP